MPFNSGRSAIAHSAAGTWYDASPHPHALLAPALRARQLDRPAVLHVRGALPDMRRPSRKSMRMPQAAVLEPPSPRCVRRTRLGAPPPLRVRFIQRNRAAEPRGKGTVYTKDQSDYLMLVQGHVFDDGVVWQVPTGKRYCINVRLLSRMPA
jgi:hypothetical protein